MCVCVYMYMYIYMYIYIYIWPHENISSSTPPFLFKQSTTAPSYARSLIEDQTKQMMSYAKFLLHCHRYVLSKA